MKCLLFLFLAGLLLPGCTPPEAPHTEKRSVYYWKTAFVPDSVETDFLRDHQVGRIYLRMFDVSVNHGRTPGEEPVVPNATVRFPDDWYYEKVDWFASLEFVPVVYLTLDALKAMAGNEEHWAAKIVGRVKNMCSYNRLPNVEELQLDCDWTATTESSFFALCDWVKVQMRKSGLDWRLSSTIRLHQLARKAPPVDCGVLMVYNTGSFASPDTRNSILDEADVRPYLKHLPRYPLHLDIAYPTYSWQLLFRNRQFAGLLNGVNVCDTTFFSAIGNHRYRAKKKMLTGNRLIRPNDVIRTEASGFEEIFRVKSLVEDALTGRDHSVILYHLDSDNLLQYKKHEINVLFTTCVD